MLNSQKNAQISQILIIHVLAAQNQYIYQVTAKIYVYITTFDSSHHSITSYKTLSNWGFTLSNSSASSSCKRGEHHFRLDLR
jgi:hypothetical protein